MSKKIFFFSIQTDRKLSKCLINDKKSFPFHSLCLVMGARNVSIFGNYNLTLESAGLCCFRHTLWFFFLIADGGYIQNIIVKVKVTVLLYYQYHTVNSISMAVHNFHFYSN